ncbi:MAG: zinc-ribbon and DUF3426 domain-containing protein [Desulfovibrio sp.]|nr:zinc-ribbon and DUF3426 domain-containing protein [Desulfovibrio sp.]
MEVKCPGCSSRFNLPDTVAKPGVKLRCSVCSKVFPLQLETPETLPEQPLPKKGRLKKVFVLLAMLLLCGGGVAGGVYYALLRKDPPTQQEIEAKVRHLTMRGTRQYMVQNDHGPKVMVIQGRVVNEFPEPKDFITVEAALYDKDKKVLIIKEQMAGTSLSLVQLQVMSEKDIQALLENKMEILTNNTNVRHGGEVPFMVVFYDPPEGVAEWGVRISDVKDTPNNGGTAAN